MPYIATLIFDIHMFDKLLWCTESTLLPIKVWFDIKHELLQWRTWKASIKADKALISSKKVFHKSHLIIWSNHNQRLLQKIKWNKFCYCRNRRRALWRKHSILLEKWIKQYKLGRIRQVAILNSPIVTSWRTESSNISLVVLDKLLFWIPLS